MPLLLEGAARQLLVAGLVLLGTAKEARVKAPTTKPPIFDSTPFKAAFPLSPLFSEFSLQIQLRWSEEELGLSSRSLKW